MSRENAERDVAVGDRVVRVRDVGDPVGCAVLLFHGTPSSRLDLHLSEDLAAKRGVRLVSFDRPGYGGSTPAPFGLTSIARDVEAIADGLNIERFAAFGQSAGSRYALAAAATLGHRVACVGLASGSGPAQEVPGGLDDLDDNDKAMLRLLPDDPARAAEIGSAWYEPVIRLVHGPLDDDALVAALEPGLATADVSLLQDPAIRAGAAANLRESLRQGAAGAGWDALSWLGDWDIDLDAIRCPVFVWFGDDDTTPLANAEWLNDRLRDSRLVLWPGEGHLAYKQHLDEIFDALVDTSR